MIIISDSHVGTSKWQYDVLVELGYDVKISTYSKHKRYLAKESQFESNLFRFLHYIPTIFVRFYFAHSKRYKNINLVICSFPPLRVKDLLKLPNNIKIICNIGHRFHIHFEKYGFSSLVKVNDYFKQVIENPRILLSSMSLYDSHYFEYYIGSKPSFFLPVLTNYRAQEFTYLNTEKLILIGPSHNLNKIIGYDSLEELNQVSKNYATQNNTQRIVFAFIKDVYQDATIENISKHSAVIIIPYSAFSISMVEIIQSGIPVIIPCDSLLIDNMNDVRLYPLYSSSKKVNLLDKRYKSPTNPYSPNSDFHDSQIEWLKYMYFNNAEGILRYESGSNLIELIYNSDFSSIRKMNLSRHETNYIKEDWKKALQACELV